PPPLVARRGLPGRPDGAPLPCPPRLRSAGPRPAARAADWAPSPLPTGPGMGPDDAVSCRLGARGVLPTPGRAGRGGDGPPARRGRLAGPPARRRGGRATRHPAGCAARVADPTAGVRGPMIDLVYPWRWLSDGVGT